MPRILHIPGVIALFCAFVLLFLVSISLPYLTALDFARVHFNSGSASSGLSNSGVSQLRFGSWAYCFYDNDGARTCSSPNNAYSTVVYANADKSSWQTVGPSWTRGLAVHPVACGVTFIALLLSFSTHITFTLFASLISFLAAVLTVVAFAIDIALYAFVKHQMHKLDGVNTNTNTAPAFWMTFVSILLLTFAGFTVCFGRRRDRMADSTTYPATTAGKFSWRDRFRRNRY